MILWNWFAVVGIITIGFVVLCCIESEIHKWKERARLKKQKAFADDVEYHQKLRDALETIVDGSTFIGPDTDENAVVRLGIIRQTAQDALKIPRPGGKKVRGRVIHVAPACVR